MTGQRAEGRAGRWLAIGASVVVAVTLAAAIAAMGSPAAQREARLDRKRVCDLQHIADAVDSHMEINGTLPSDLATLANKPGRRLSTVDPKDGSPYGYKITGARTFRLCAVFATDTAATLGGAGCWNREWNHGTGRQCFDRVADNDD